MNPIELSLSMHLTNSCTDTLIVIHPINFLKGSHTRREREYFYCLSHSNVTMSAFIVHYVTMCVICTVLLGGRSVNLNERLTYSFIQQGLRINK